MEDTIEFTEAILEKLMNESYNFMVCTPMNIDTMLNVNANDSKLVILFSPVREIMDGFRLLKELNKESFLLTFEEVEDEICKTKEPHLKFFINKNFSS